MNAFDYFFENTSRLDKPFLVGKEEISFIELHIECNASAGKLAEITGVFMEEHTLEMLTREYQVIIFKHCFPVNKIAEDQASAKH